MLPVEIYCRNENVILRARNSEILILPAYTRVLRTLTDPKGFSEYFLHDALVNRPARKLFEAWIRKDVTLWPRLFQTIQTHIPHPDEAVQAESVDASPTEEAGEAKKPTTKKPAAPKKAPVAKVGKSSAAVSSAKKVGRKKV